MITDEESVENDNQQQDSESSEESNDGSSEDESNHDSGSSENSESSNITSESENQGAQTDTIQPRRSGRSMAGQGVTRLEPSIHSKTHDNVNT